MPAQAAGLSLRASLETGSRQIVKLHQIDRGTGIVARQGGFFIGFAKQKPKVFLGGMGFCVAGRDDFFVLHVGRADALRAMLQ